MTRATQTKSQKPPSEPGDVLVAHWSEAELERYVRTTARAAGWRVYHTSFSLGSDAGYPDYALCRPPRYILAELKTMTGALTRGRLTKGRWPRWTNGQADWLRDLLACPGLETYLWRPSHHRDIALILSEGPEPGMRCIRELEAELAA